MVSSDSRYKVTYVTMHFNFYSGQQPCYQSERPKISKNQLLIADIKVINKLIKEVIRVLITGYKAFDPIVFLRIIEIRYKNPHRKKKCINVSALWKPV